MVDGRLLLARMRGTKTSFLPGGHVELGESIEGALVREIKEELGTPCCIHGYLGAVENIWIADGMREAEIFHIFHIHIPQLGPGGSVVSLERKSEFFWCPITDLETVRLLPAVLIPMIKRWVSGDPRPWWGTTHIPD